MFNHFSFLRETLPRQEGNNLIMVLKDHELLSSASLKTISREKYGDEGFLGEDCKSQSEKEDGKGSADSLVWRESFSKEERTQGLNEQRKTCQGLYWRHTGLARPHRI